MERHNRTGPRANRSKKTLPAAFFDGRVRGRENGRESGRESGAESGGEPGAFRSDGSIGAGDRNHAHSHAVGVHPLPPPQMAAPTPQPPMNFVRPGAPVEFADRREPIQLDSLVFLSSVPSKHGRLVMKKMLHPPTLELFCLVEFPGADHQRAFVRASLQDWLVRWCALQADHAKLLVSVREAFWDAPQGYPMGILCEYMPLGSLDELVRACGGVPEEAMREIAQAVLEALDTLHSANPPVVHGCVKPSQVLFRADGQLALAPGLEQRLKFFQVWSADNLGAAESQPSSQSTAVDIFDLGLLLLVAALGGMDVLLDAIPYAREFGSGQQRGSSAPLSAVFHDTCALLQHELRGGGSEEHGASNDGMGFLPPASDLLFNRRYSGPFLAFVSTCLEAHTQSSPVSAKDLLQHEFLRGQTPVGPLVSLREMQGLSRLLNEAPEHDPTHFGPAGGRSAVPGVAPAVAQSAQSYLMNIAQSVAPLCSSMDAAAQLYGADNADCGVRVRSWSDSEAAIAGVQPRWRQQEWEILLTDTARTLGLPQTVVRQALEAHLERIVQGAMVRERRAHSELIAPAIM